MKDVFFYIGSTLGILAFIRASIEPLITKNQLRWNQVLEQIDDSTFENLVYEASFTSRFYDRTLDPINRFAHDIENKASYLRFGPLLKTKYTKELNCLKRLHGEFINLVQVPEWEPYGQIEADENSGWRLNKMAFDKGKGFGEGYDKHLIEVARIARDMRNTFRHLEVLSDLTFLEIVFSRITLSKKFKQVEV